MVWGSIANKVIFSVFLFVFLVSFVSSAKGDVLLTQTITTTLANGQVVKVVVPINDGVYSPCPQEAQSKNNRTTVTNSSGGLGGTFPQPNNFTCLPTGLSVIIHQLNITGLNSTQTFGTLNNITNNSNHMTTMLNAVIDILNQTGMNFTITVSGPYASNITIGNITSTSGSTITVTNSSSHPTPGTGSTGGGNNPSGGAGNGGGTGGGGSGGGGTGMTGTGFVRADGTAHFIIVIDGPYCEPYLRGVFYGGRAVGIKWACDIIYWDPWDNQYHQSVMTMDGEWINVGGQWGRVGDTVRITRG